MSDADVEKVWRDFWAPLLEKDGAVDIEAVKRELFDYANLLDEVPRVYMHVSGGMISKPNTHASAVISVADDNESERWDEREKEVLADRMTDVIDCLRRLGRIFPSGVMEAAVEAIAREFPAHPAPDPTPKETT